VALVTLVSALPWSRLTYPVLAFSGTQLAVIRFRPVLAAWSLQTAVRYGGPLVPFVWRRRETPTIGRGNGRISLPVPSSRAVSRPARAAE
jgi:hypothetical protein